MPVDILIFGLIAAFLIYRLNSVLGTRHGDERQRANPFGPQKPVAKAAPAVAPRTVVPLRPVLAPAAFDQIVDAEANKDGRVETGLTEIAAADPTFDVNTFMQGARAVFPMVAAAYTEGDLDTLKPLLSPKLYADFAAGVRARDGAGHKAEITIHRIKAARIIEAHLGGTMAYVTVDYDVEETTVTRDAGGNVVSGDPDRIFSVEDVWTFTRDIRSEDLNWTLIETRAVEK